MEGDQKGLIVQFTPSVNATQVFVLRAKEEYLKLLLQMIEVILLRTRSRLLSAKRIMDHGSWVMDQGSRIKDQGRRMGAQTDEAEKERFER